MAILPVKKYAGALATNLAEINQCPPGGDEGIFALAQLLKRSVMPLNPANGSIKPRQLVVIDEDVCIGCTLCIKACPVDAIIGANKMLHTVIASECTGCDLCIPACPVDCIHHYDDPEREWGSQRRDLAKARFNAHQNRREQEQQAREQRMAQQAQLLKILSKIAKAVIIFKIRLHQISLILLLILWHVPKGKNNHSVTN